MRAKCKACDRKFFFEEIVSNPINFTQIEKKHGTKVYRCISIDC